MRDILQFPPFAKLCAIYLTSKDQNAVGDYAQSLASFARTLKEKHFQGVDLLGVRPAIVEKRENKFTWTILLRAVDTNMLHNFIKTLSRNMNNNYKVSVKFDIDPRHLH